METNKQILDAIKKNGIDIQVWTHEQAEQYLNYRNNLRQVSEEFDKQLDLQIDGLLNKNHTYQMGYPGEVLLSTGIPNVPIQMKASRLNQKSTDEKHPYDLRELKGLIQEMQNPIAVFLYGNENKAQNIIVGLQYKEKNFLIGMSLNPSIKGLRLEINSVRNVFPKTNKDWLGWIQQNKALYIDKERIQNLIAQQRINHADVDNQNLDSITKIVKEFENPKLFKQIQLQDRNIFYSNALFALQNIKQEKATPQQWLAMLNKNGGIKKDEDKWIGLSEWLQSQSRNSLNKQEIADYIKENQLQIEDVFYTEFLTDNGSTKLDEFNRIFKEYMAEGEEVTNSLFIGDHVEYALNKMKEEYGDDLEDAFDIVNDHGSYELSPTLGHFDELTDTAARYLETGKIINSTRFDYTTPGLQDKAEIALVVPSVEPWNEKDEIFFGDAGGGRAIAWVRFGTTLQKHQVTDKEIQEFVNGIPQIEDWDKVDADKNQLGKNLYYPPGERGNKFRNCIIDMGNGKFELEGPIKTKLFNCTFYDINDARNVYCQFMFKQMGQKEDKILFIDEIQSKRHQDAQKKVKKRGEEVKLGYIPRGIYTQMENLNKEKIIALNEYYDTLNNISVTRGWGNKPVPDKVMKEWMDESPELKEKYGRMKDTLHRAADFRIKHKITGNEPIEAPFEKNWHELCMKRMFRYAAENGYDKIAWTTGEQQGDRYDLSRVVNQIKVSPYKANSSIEVDGCDVWLLTDKGNISMYVTKDGEITGCDSEIADRLKGKLLHKVVGNNLADKILSADEYMELEGNDVKIGISGMKDFYDKTIPDFMNKYGKKWDVKTNLMSINLEGTDLLCHSIDVTPKMRESVLQGQPMYMFDKRGQMLGVSVGNKICLLAEGFNPETMLHEYTHIWANAMRYGNKEGWESIKRLLKDTPLWNEIKENPFYMDIRDNEDYIASEVLAHISGKENAAKLEKLAQNMPEQIMKRIKEALQKFWSWVGIHMFDIQKFNSIGEVTDRILYDLAKGQKIEAGKPVVEGDDREMERMSHVAVYKGLYGVPYIRCKIDGVQQFAQKIKQEEMDTCNPENIYSLAEKYYSKQLHGEDVKQSMKR